LPNGGANQWPAWWFISSPKFSVENSETDIAEAGYQIPGTTNGVAPIHLHNWAADYSSGSSQGDYLISSLPITPGGWQVFGVWFQPGMLTVYLNGQKVTNFNVGANFSVPEETIFQMTNFKGHTTSTLGELDVQYVRCWTAQ